MPFPDLHWYYVLPVLLICFAIWVKHTGVWTVAVLSVVFSIWMQTPYRPAIFSNRPWASTVYSGGVWVLPPTDAKLSVLKSTANAHGIAYSENSYVAGCQQKTGVQLLAFPNVKSVWTHAESRWCSEDFASVPKVFEIDVRNQSTMCQKAIAEIFTKPQESMPCLNKSYEIADRRGWDILLNCSQSKREYQLRWRFPNMLSGGDALQSFAGVEFHDGECLDPSHEESIGLLLDVVGLGRGTAHYDEAPN